MRNNSATTHRLSDWGFWKNAFVCGLFLYPINCDLFLNLYQCIKLKVGIPIDWITLPQILFHRKRQNANQQIDRPGITKEQADYYHQNSQSRNKMIYLIKLSLHCTILLSTLLHIHFIVLLKYAISLVRLNERIFNDTNIPFPKQLSMMLSEVSN